uniref:Calcium channel, voltage-dependent, gamma subunit 8a n=1 Tax=Pundamilia nyererei TaxID=303518 RepID=A0A3B4F3G4_9CICH
MVWCERGIQVLLTTMGAFAAFALMTVAIGTDYWLYARAFICNSTANSSQEDSNNKDKKDPGALTHSGLWRICCLEGTVGCVSVCIFETVRCFQCVVRASSIFPILSAILLLLGGVCVASSGFYKSKRNIILGGGILFVAAGKTIGLALNLHCLFTKQDTESLLFGILNFATLFNIIIKL